MQRSTGNWIQTGEGTGTDGTEQKHAHSGKGRRHTRRGGDRRQGPKREGESIAAVDVTITVTKNMTVTSTFTRTPTRPPLPSPARHWIPLPYPVSPPSPSKHTTHADKYCDKYRNRPQDWRAGPCLRTTRVCPPTTLNTHRTRTLGHGRVGLGSDTLPGVRPVCPQLRRRHVVLGGPEDSDVGGLRDAFVRDFLMCC